LQKGFYDKSNQAGTMVSYETRHLTNFTNSKVKEQFQQTVKMILNKVFMDSAVANKKLHPLFGSMFSFVRLACIVTLLVFSVLRTEAQVAVTVSGNTNTTPNLAASYVSLANAITALNTVTAFSGPVTLTCAPGSETAPAGGYAISFTGTTSATNTITINTSGTVTLTAFTPQASGSLSDAIFKLIGADRVSISGFTMRENPANTSLTDASNNMTEWGIALLCPSTSNGAQNNTIQNNTISLNRAYANSFAIYSNVRHTPTNVNQTGSIINPSSPSGSNSGNKVYSNTISNVNYGIVFIGPQSYVTPFATMDSANDIGGNSAATGNTLSNCGGVKATGGYIDILSNPYCIHMRNQTDFNLSYNTITSATFNTTAPLAGIYITGSPANDNSAFTQNITYNTLTVTSTGNTSFPHVLGILHENLNSVLPNATVNITQNTLLNCQSSTSFTGINFSSARPGTCNINSNIFQNTSVANDFTAVTTSGTTGANVSSPLMNVNNNRIQGTIMSGVSGKFTGFNINGGVPQTLNLNANLIGTPGNNAVTFPAASGGSFRGIDISFASSTGTVNIEDNDFRGVVHNAASTTSYNFVNLAFPATSGTPLNLNTRGNTFTNLSLNTSGQVVFFQHSYPMPANGSQIYNNNAIVTGFSSNGLVIIFENTNASSPNSASVSYINNNFSNINGSQLFGIRSNNNASVTSKTVTGNTFSNWNVSLACNPIVLTGLGGGTTNLIANNTINSMTVAAGGLTGIMLGHFSGNNPVTVSGNTLTGLTVSGTGSTTGIWFGSSTAIAGTTVSIFDNNIRNLSSGNTGLMAGIICGGASIRNIYNNKISDLTCPGSNSNILAGIYLTLSVPNNSTSNIYNNRIGNITASQSPDINAVIGITIDEPGTSTSAIVNVYYNTIYLNNLISSAANFGASGIFAHTMPSLTLKNNLVWISGTANGGGRLAAYRRSGASLTSYNAASNNNMFYAGTPGANNLIYVEGVTAATYTNPLQTLAAYKAFMAMRDQASTTGTPSFLNTTGQNADFLKLNPGGNLVGVDNAGTPVAGIATDFEGDQRGSTPEIGADEIASTPCGNTLATVTVQPTCSVLTGTIVVSDPVGPDIEYSIGGAFQASPSFSGVQPGSYAVTAKNKATGCIYASDSVTVKKSPCASLCNGNGNLIIYTNYEGGFLNINIDQDIPNLKIGISTYEAAQISISGPFVGNVTEVIYAGYDDANNTNCGATITNTTISGVVPAIVRFIRAPLVGYRPKHNKGWPTVIGSSKCDTLSSSGGVNSPDEIVYYFTNATGGTLRFHNTQYGCWPNQMRKISDGGNCCIEPTLQCPPGSNTAPEATVTQQPSCTNAKGSIEVTAPTGANIQYSVGSGYQSDRVFTGLDPGNYTVTARFPGGCITPARSITLNAPEKPEKPVISHLSAGQVQLADTVCTGDTAVVSYFISNSQAGLQYDWVLSAGGTIITASNDTLSVRWSDVQGNYTIRVSAAGSGSCASDTAAFPVLLQKAPEITLKPADVEICNGEPVVVRASGADSYVWSPAQGLSPANADTAIVAPLVNTIYTVTGSKNGCSASKTFSAEVSAKPVAGFSFEQTGNYFLQFTNTSTGASSYLWDFGSGNTSTEENPLAEFPFDDRYTITLIVQGACGSDTLTQTVEVIKLSVTELSGTRLLIGPNPTSGQVMLKALMQHPQQLQVRLYNMVGQVIDEKQAGGKTELQIPFDLSGYAKGIYYLQVTQGGDVMTFKLVRE
jgi:hypothetical protein